MGEAVELPRPVDWRSCRLPEDREWRILWYKFLYGLDLAHAFRLSGEAHFLDCWQDLVLSFLEQVRPGEPPDSSDVLGRRLASWIFAWDLFAGAESFRGLRPGAGERILAGIAAGVDHLVANLTVGRNHRTLELAALAYAPLAFPSLDPDGEVLAFALEELARNLRTDFLADGVHRELSTHYHLEALRNFLGVRENARRYGVAVPPGFDAQLARACTFALHVHRPDGAIAAFSDADGGGYRHVLALAADLFARDDLRFVATAGREGTPPAETSPSFPSSGYHVQRSAWRAPGEAFADARFLLFDCGRLGAGGHGHYDALHCEAWARGRPLLVDPGRYTYSEAGAVNWRHWFKSTAAHNTLVVDGLDQTPYARNGPRRGSEARARLLGRATAPRLDVLEGEVTSTVYEAVHRRRIVFVADEYWLLEDALVGERAHRCELRFHLAPGAQADTRLRREGSIHRVEAPALTLLAITGGEARLEPGWIAPRYGTKEAAPVVVFAGEAAKAEHDFLTLLCPPPRTPERLSRRWEDGVQRIEIDFAGGDGRCRDVVWLSAGDRPFTCGPWRLRARCAWLRRSAAGEVLAAAAAGVAWAEVAGDSMAFSSSDGSLSWEQGETRVATAAAETARATAADAAPPQRSAAHRRVYDHGAGDPALVLVPGWLIDAPLCRFQVERFASTRRVVVHELWASGGPADDDPGRCRQRLTNELAASIDALGLVRPVVMGHGLGAALALAYALAFPARLAGLVLVNPLPRHPELRERSRDTLRRLRAVLEHSTVEDVAGALRERFFLPSARRARRREVAAWEARLVERCPAEVLQLLRVVVELDQPFPRRGEHLPPTLLVAGSDDSYFRDSDFDELAGAIPGCERHRLTGVGHLPMLEAPEAFNDLLSAFLARLTSG